MKKRLYILICAVIVAIVTVPWACLLAGTTVSANGFAVGKKARKDLASANIRTGRLGSDDAATGVDSLREEEEQRVDEMLHNKKLFPFGQRRVVAYAGMRYDTKGKPRLKEMISRLVDLGVNCYSYLIDAHSKEELAALPHFCDLASKARIEVWVVLVPPTEEPKPARGNHDGIRYPPYGLDYLKWARDISVISKKHSNLTLLMIDDFLYNLKCFTPQYVAKIHKILDRENKRLLLGLTIYANQLGRTKEINRYEPYADAVEWGYQHKSNLSPDYGISAQSLPAEISEFWKVFPHRILIPCIYFTPHSSWSRKATSAYLKEAMTLAYNDAGVALIFRTPERGTVNYDIVKTFCHERILSSK